METVTVLTAEVVEDGYGDDTMDWTTPTRVDVLALGVEPRPSGEPVQEARNSITSGFTLYLPTGTAITPANRVEIRGSVYDVMGEAGDWRGLSGWTPGLVVQTQRTAG